MIHAMGEKETLRHDAVVANIRIGAGIPQHLRKVSSAFGYFH